jgi:hypothetical protein
LAFNGALSDFGAQHGAGVRFVAGHYEGGALTIQQKRTERRRGQADRRAAEKIPGFIARTQERGISSSQWEGGPEQTWIKPAPRRPGLLPSKEDRASAMGSDDGPT